MGAEMMAGEEVAGSRGSRKGKAGEQVDASRSDGRCLTAMMDDLSMYRLATFGSTSLDTINRRKNS